MCYNDSTIFSDERCKSYRAAAEIVAADIASMNSADQALRRLLARTGLT